MNSPTKKPGIPPAIKAMALKAPQGRAPPGAARDAAQRANTEEGLTLAPQIVVGEQRGARVV